MAIAYDTGNHYLGTNTGSFTPGSLTNGIMLCSFYVFGTASAFSFNAASGTLIDTVAGSGAFAGYNAYVYAVLAPASGAHNWIITASATVGRVQIVTYSGVNQSTTLDAVTKGQASQNTFSQSVTSVANNCWVVLYTSQDAGNDGTLTNCTMRQESSTAVCVSDSNVALSPGSHSMSIAQDTGGNVNWMYIMMSIAPPATPPFSKSSIQVSQGVKRSAYY